MPIFKVRWWIPVSLLLLSAMSFLAIDYYNARRVIELEKSNGLGAVADTSILFHLERRPSALLAPRAQLFSAEAPGSEEYGNSR